MKTNFSTLRTASMSVLFFAGFAFAGDQEKMVIELKTNDFVIGETDVSNLAIGEAQTIVTDSGKTIDILRTTSGVEVYVDGELFDEPQLHEGHNQVIHKHVEVECTADGEEYAVGCGEKMMFFSEDEAPGAESVQRHVIVKRSHPECTSDQQGECKDQQVWISEAADAEFAELHEAIDGTHKVIRIHQTHEDDAHVESNVEKVIIIKKDSEEEL